jgi:hypothetical protein
VDQIEEILCTTYEMKTGGPRSGIEGKTPIQSLSVWNLQPHVRLIHQKEHQRLDNQILVEEKRKEDNK